MAETCRRKLETIKVIYTLISAFIGITYMNEVCINAQYRTQKAQLLNPPLSSYHRLERVSQHAPEEECPYFA
jgi:hypothetical protein